MTQERVLLYSGGVDSFIAYEFLNRPLALYCKMDTHYTLKEMNSIAERKHPAERDGRLMKTCVLGWLGRHARGVNAEIDFRNLYMAMAAVTMFEASKVYIAGLADDNMPDKTEQMFMQWSDMLTTMAGRKVKVVSPFWHVTKADIVKWYATHCNKQRLLDTVSCFSKDPDEHHCGKCRACFRKGTALFTVNLFIPFTNKVILNEYRKAINDTDYYHPQRQAAMTQYIKRCDEDLRN